MSPKPGKEAWWRHERKWFIYWVKDRRLPGVTRTSNDTRIKPQTILYDPTSHWHWFMHTRITGAEHTAHSDICRLIFAVQLIVVCECSDQRY